MRRFSAFWARRSSALRARFAALGSSASHAQPPEGGAATAAATGRPFRYLRGAGAAVAAEALGGFAAPASFDGWANFRPPFGPRCFPFFFAPDVCTSGGPPNVTCLLSCVASLGKFCSTSIEVGLAVLSSCSCVACLSCFLLPTPILRLILGAVGGRTAPISAMQQAPQHMQPGGQFGGIVAGCGTTWQR